MTITNDQIQELRTEAGEAGDIELVAICEIALDSISIDPGDHVSPLGQAIEAALVRGDTIESARAECARCIESARAMVE